MKKHGRWGRFGGMTWPLPERDEDDSVEWRLRYGTPTKEDLLVAASYMHAYTALIFKTQKARNDICTKIKILDTSE